MGDMCTLNSTDGANGTNALDTKNSTSSYDYLKYIGQAMDNYYMMVLFAVGLPGNTLTIVTILSMESISTATILVAFLASCDIGALISKLILNRLINQHGYFGQVGCKLVNTLTVTFATVANWTLVLICLERFIAVRFPFRKSYLVSRRRCVLSAAMILLVITALTTTFFVMVYEVDDTGYICLSKNISDEIFFLIVILFYVVFPLVFITVLTLGTVMTLCAFQRTRRNMFRDERQSRPRQASNKTSGTFKNDLILVRRERREKTINVLVIFTGVLFIIIHLPPSIFFLSFVYSFSKNDPTLNLLYIINYIILDSSHVLNFFLFFLTARKFRSQLLKVLKLEVCRERSNGNISRSSLTNSISR